VIILVLLATVLTANVQAYIDPGTGSYVFQVAAAGLLTVLYAVKRHWRQLRDWARSLRRGSSPSAGAGQDEGRGRLD